MKYPFVLLTLAASACQVIGPEEQLEDKIRDELSKQGDVRSVEMHLDGENRMTGIAVMRNRDGEVRMRCTANMGEERATFVCGQEIDEAMLGRIEDNIRSEYTRRRFTVLHVDLQKAGDDRMSGYTDLRDPEGNQGRLSCTAERHEVGGDFDWHCGGEQGDGARPR